MDFLNERKKAGGALLNEWLHLEELYTKKYPAINKTKCTHNSKMINFMF
jgi:hypothetical protein